MGNGQTDRRRDGQTDGHCNSMTDLARSAKSVKKLLNQSLISCTTKQPQHCMCDRSPSGLGRGWWSQLGCHTKSGE